MEMRFSWHLFQFILSKCCYSLLLRAQSLVIQSSNSLPKGSGIVNITVIEKFLQEINVKRQAYHSQSFAGNHVDICLKVISQNKKHIDISDYYPDLYP